MCGIIGQIRVSGAIDPVKFDRMRDTLIHRGPDDAGSCYFDEGKIALGHRRLSFLDLSSAGRQPMSDEDNAICITLNGEIYNYVELREELITYGHHFKSNTDTEVILCGYKQWGIEVINRLKGMFAFGLLDLNRHKLYLVRDRFGIKPLYYHYTSDGLIFASELKAILEDRLVKREVDYTAFADFFVYRYIPSPKTIWRDIFKIAPAHFLEYNINSNQLIIKEYWNIPFGKEKKDELDLIKSFSARLDESIKMHSRSDVPIGSFLSGGYDSSAIVLYLTRAGYRPETFSVGFRDWPDSEDRFADIVASACNVHITKTLADFSSLDLMNMMPMVYDEPIADISIIPTWMVSHLATDKVKAVMSGEGADELLGGYSWQKEFFAIKHKSFWQKVKARFNSKQESTVSYYAEAMAMGRFNAAELSKLLTPDYHKFIPSDTDWFYRKNYDHTLSPLKSIQKLDIKCFMGELVLTKIDRASMSNSLEVRVPFLDHELYKTVLETNEKTYFKPEVTKFLLFENIKNLLPKEILNRKKQGFVGPDSYYMDLGFYTHTLDKSALIANNIVKKEYYLQLVANKDFWRLWKLLVMEKWYQHWCT